jgi:leucyl aminopeptidase (aminopeptidase T)
MMRISTLSEGRDEYYEFEKARASHRLINEVLQVHSGQQVLITADTQSDKRVVESNARAVLAAGGVPVVLYYPTGARPQMEPPPVVAAAVLCADVWIEHAVSFVMYSRAWHEAKSLGVQYYSGRGLDVDGMVRCIGRQQIDLLVEFGKVVEQVISDSQQMRVTSRAGTEIQFKNQKSTSGSFKMKANPQKTPIMLAGQISWEPQEGSVQGKIIGDGSLYPPSEVGLLYDPVELAIENGYIQAITGDKEAKLLQNWLNQLDDPNLYRIAHVSIGFNPGIQNPTGRLIEDERAFGHFDFGWGAWVGRPASAHFDISCQNVSCWSEEQQILDDGKFIHPELSDIYQEILVQGTSCMD